MGVHSVVYLATENDNVYAFNSFTGARLKKVNLGTPVPRPLNCENNGDAVGINSTPTIDRKAGLLYVIAYVMDGVTPIHQLHMLDLSTLQDKIPPVTITASNTLADGSTYTFDSSVQRQRPALLQASGNIYAGFGSYCDFKSSHSRGWVLGWRQSTLAPLTNTPLLSKTQATSTFDCYFHAPWTSNHPCYLASVWMSGYGLATDSSGNLFFTTGNTGVSDAGVSFYDSVNDIADTMVKLAPDLGKVVDFFTPANVSALDQVDSDFGSGGTLVLPDQPGPTPAPRGRRRQGRQPLHRRSRHRENGQVPEPQRSRERPDRRRLPLRPIVFQGIGRRRAGRDQRRAEPRAVDDQHRH